jgi:hypothetical protein
MHVHHQDVRFPLMMSLSGEHTSFPAAGIADHSGGGTAKNRRARRKVTRICSTRIPRFPSSF